MVAKKQAGASGKKNQKKQKTQEPPKEETVESGPVETLEVAAINIPEDLFGMHLNKVKGLADKLATAQSNLARAMKDAKKDNKDLPTVIRLAMKYDRTDRETLKHEFQLQGFALKAIESPIQFVLHDSTLGDVNEVARKIGYKDGIAAKTPDSPYPEGSDLDKIYHESYMDGQKENMSGIHNLEPNEGNPEGREDPLFNSDPPHSVDDVDDGFMS